MKKLIAIAALVVSPVALADYTQEDYCQGLAGFAENVAKDRDNGVPMGATINTVIESLMPIDEGQDGVLDDMITIVEVSYKYPRLTPGEEGNIVYGVCMDTNTI